MINPLEIILSGVLSWATGKLLDVFFGCSRCGNTHAGQIANRSINHLFCPYCFNSLPQYVNVCRSTFNEHSRRIGVAGISAVWWRAWGGSPRSNFEPHFRVWTLNVPERDSIARLQLSKTDGRIFYRDDIVIHALRGRSLWDVWFKVPSSYFPKYSTTVTVDLKILSEYNDLLAFKGHLMDVACYSRRQQHTNLHESSKAIGLRKLPQIVY